MDEPVEVAQKINVVRLVQTDLEALAGAASPYRAALRVVSIYYTLAGLRRLDADFEAEWSQVLDGHFLEVVGSEDAWLDLDWVTVAQAKGVLLDLMERHGMGLQAALNDPLDGREVELEGDLTDLENRGFDDSLEEAGFFSEESSVPSEEDVE